MRTVLVLVLGCTLLFAGTLPIGRSQFFLHRLISLEGITGRVSGLLIIVMSFSSIFRLSSTLVVVGWVTALILLFISMIAQLSGRAR